MVFKPHRCRTRWEGVAVALWIVLIDLQLLIWMGRRPIDLLKFLLIFLAVASLPLLAYIVYRTWAAFNMEYWIDRNAITLRWANMRQVIPLQAVQRVVQGGLQSLDAARLADWPAPYLRSTRTLGLNQVQMVATQPLDQCLLLDAGQAVFAVSPVDQAGFLEALQGRYRLGPVAHLELARVRSSAWQRLFGEGPAGVALLAAGMVGALTLFGLLMVQFPNLPDALAFHYNSEGLPDVVREKTALFLLPAVGLLAWVINGLWGLWLSFHHQRTGAYMLWAGAIIVQICSFLALTSLMY
jgi:hypothetical protein